MLHRVLASNRPGRTLAAEGVLFAMQESLFPILGSVATAAGSTRSFCSCGEGGRRIPAPGHRLVPRAEVSADRDEYGTKGEEQHP
jgi:hypothetical protein